MLGIFENNRHELAFENASILGGLITIFLKTTEVWFHTQRLTKYCQQLCLAIVQVGFVISPFSILIPLLMSYHRKHIQVWNQFERRFSVNNVVTEWEIGESSGGGAERLGRQLLEWLLVLEYGGGGFGATRSLASATAGRKEINLRM